MEISQSLFEYDGINVTFVNIFHLVTVKTSVIKTFVEKRRTKSIFPFSSRIQGHIHFILEP